MYVDLLLNTENKEYWSEKGYSLKGLTNAGISFVKSKVQGGEARGGSTIEQQLIKNLVFSTSTKDRTIDRKIKELWLSTQMNKNFSKEQILEWYINLIFMGEGSYGANTIALTYYGKPLTEFKDRSPETISKLAIISGLGQSPSLYNLYDNPEAVEKRRNIVLTMAKDSGVISQEEFDKAKNVKVTSGLTERHWRNKDNVKTLKTHNAYIQSALQQVSEMGYDLSKTSMQIHTGLDKKTDAWVKTKFDTSPYYKSKEQQVAATIIDPKSGFVMAEYGGRYTEPHGINRATSRNRSSGSAIKPFLSYGTAIEFFNYGSGHRLDSSNYVYPGTNFVARNYGGATYGYVDMTFALKMSLNTPTNRLLDQVVGSKNAKDFLAGMDMDVKESYGGSDALGLNVSTRDLANASATLARDGIHKKPQYISKIKFDDGSERKVEFEEKRAMRESTAFILKKMMNEVPKKGGTAEDAAIPAFRGYAVKTGTVGYGPEVYWHPAGAASDSWIVGTTKNVSMAIWLGYDTPNKVGHYNYDQAKTYKYLFREIMLHLNRGKDTSDWVQPSTVRGGGTSFTPIDEVRKKSNLYTPTVDNRADFSSLAKVPGSKIIDKGTPSYNIDGDYTDIVNWESNVDNKDLLDDWKTGQSATSRLKENENIN